MGALRGKGLHKAQRRPSPLRKPGQHVLSETGQDVLSYNKTPETLTGGTPVLRGRPRSRLSSVPMAVRPTG